MQTITTKTKAIKTLILADNKDAVISDCSKKDLLNTYESYKKGKLEFMTADEFKKDLLKNGYEWK